MAMFGLVAVVLAVGVLSFSSTTGSSQSDRDTLVVALRHLSHRSAEIRQQGLNEVSERIRVDEAVRTRSDLQLALAAMLRAEHRRIRDFVATHGNAEEYPYLEAYQEHLLPAALSVLPHATAATESELVSALMSGAFNRGSRVALAIAAAGEGAVTAALDSATSASAVERSKGYDLLGEMLGRHRAGTLRHPLSAASAAQARRALLLGLSDSDIVCRRNAIRGVVKAREHTAIPTLRILADTDPDDGRTGLARNSVRALAARAIETLAAPP
jgi:hypothetical protein